MSRAIALATGAREAAAACTREQAPLRVRLQMCAEELARLDSLFRKVARLSLGRGDGEMQQLAREALD